MNVIAGWKTLRDRIYKMRSRVRWWCQGLDGVRPGGRDGIVSFAVGIGDSGGWFRDMLEVYCALIDSVKALNL